LLFDDKFEKQDVGNSCGLSAIKVGEMDVFLETDYKQALKKRLKELSSTGKRTTLKSAARALRLQYTYLSRVLNSPDMHLGEDPVFSFCEWLGFLPEESSYVMHLRALATTSQPNRRAQLTKQLNAVRQAKRVQAELQEFKTSRYFEDATYLFNPFSVLVHVALGIERYCKDPRLLGKLLGLSEEEIGAIIRNLIKLDFVEAEDPFQPQSVRNGAFHYGADHPFMRVHQQLLRSLCGTVLFRVPDERKKCFMRTFSTDAATFEKIRSQFQVFLTEVDHLLSEAKAETGVYQMNFELFRWSN